MPFDVHNWDFDAYCAEQVSACSWLQQKLEPLGDGAVSFVTELQRLLEAGLRWLDGVDRADPFWIGRNHLPTVAKLRDYTSQQLSTSAASPDVKWYNLAAFASVGVNRLAGHPAWSAAGTSPFPIGWFVAAAWMAQTYGSDGESLISDVRRAGRLSEYREALVALGSSANDGVRDWAVAILDRDFADDVGAGSSAERGEIIPE